MSRGAIHYADMPPGPTPLITGAGERVTITAFPHEVNFIIVVAVVVVVAVGVVVVVVNTNILYCRCMSAAYWQLPRSTIFLNINIFYAISMLISIYSISICCPSFQVTAVSLDSVINPMISGYRLGQWSGQWSCSCCGCCVLIYIFIQ